MNHGVLCAAADPRNVGTKVIFGFATRPSSKITAFR